jgi:hypothetical protein
MNTPEPKPASKPFKLRWYQYSLRSLILFELFCSLLCSWFATMMQSAITQRDAVAALRKLKCYAYYEDRRGPLAPGWLRNWVGDDFFDTVTSAADYAFGEDLDIPFTKNLPQNVAQPPSAVQNRPGQPRAAVPQTGIGIGSTSVPGDAFLEQAGRLPWLRKLIIFRHKPTDAGVKHLEALKQLETLRLDTPGITDAGIAHLKGLTRLRWLDLGWTDVTDFGLQYLEGLTQLEHLDLYGCKGVTDAGFKHLTGLKRLKVLNLGGTRVTRNGVTKLRAALPNCTIYGGD